MTDVQRRMTYFAASALVLAAPVLSSFGLAAQTPPPVAGMRMIATLDPATDARTFEVLEPMSGSEVLALQFRSRLRG